MLVTKRLKQIIKNFILSQLIERILKNNIKIFNEFWVIWHSVKIQNLQINQKKKNLDESKFKKK